MPKELKHKFSIGNMDLISEKYWGTLKVWSQKPHVVNKRLAGVANIASWKCVSNFHSWENIVETYLELLGLDEIEISSAMHRLGWSPTEHWTVDKRKENECYVSLRKCLPKQPNRHQPVLELEFIGAFCTSIFEK